VDEALHAIERWMRKSRIGDRDAVVGLLKRYATEWNVPWMEASSSEVLTLFKRCLAIDAKAGATRTTLVGLAKGRGYRVATAAPYKWWPEAAIGSAVHIWIDSVDPFGRTVASVAHVMGRVGSDQFLFLAHAGAIAREVGSRARR
jgi:hypothetical protein